MTDFVRRLERETAVVVVVLALAAWAMSPRTPRFALGIAGGGVLVGLAYWAIRGVVDGLVTTVRAEPAGRTGVTRPRGRGRALVKYFTRHAILALAAYAMMARLELHPVGMLIGVAAPVVAASIEAVRALRR